MARNPKARKRRQSRRADKRPDTNSILEVESVNAQFRQAADGPEQEKCALVIGGGIAGIQAALDLANARIRVKLVEKSPTLGGRMAQLDKTFPTMDCSI